VVTKRFPYAMAVLPQAAWPVVAERSVLLGVSRRGKRINLSAAQDTSCKVGDIFAVLTPRYASHVVRMAWACCHWPTAALALHRKPQVLAAIGLFAARVDGGELWVDLLACGWGWLVIAYVLGADRFRLSEL